MSKAAAMNIRVEPELRDQFIKAAAARHRPAAQELRDFMRTYVQETFPEPATVEPSERERRQEAFTAARASVELEGFTVPASVEEAASRFINGDADFSELVKAANSVGRDR